MTVYLTSYDGCSTLQGWPNVTWHVAQTLRLPQNFSGVKFCSWAIFNNKKSFLLLLPLMTIGHKAGYYCHFRVLCSVNCDTGRKKKKQKKKRVWGFTGTGRGMTFDLKVPRVGDKTASFEWDYKPNAKRSRTQYVKDPVIVKFMSHCHCQVDYGNTKVTWHKITQHATTYLNMLYQYGSHTPRRA